MRRVASWLVIAMVAGSLTACSGDDTYCSALAEQSGGLEKSDETETVEVMRQLADVAPGELESDWTTMVEFAEQFAQAKGDQAKQRELMAGLQDYESAFSTVVADARDRCDIDLDAR